MNAFVHSEISVKKRGGSIGDYYAIHNFLDCTKELCSDNRHRILHTMWGIHQVIIPIFGHTIINSQGKNINVKDLCEQDHILPDYHNRFIPTLSDFVSAMEFEAGDDFKKKINTCFQQYGSDKKIADILLSPLHNTGQLKSLVITHNSWFLNFILPKLVACPIAITDFEFAPADFFNTMKFEHWMDNGATYPASSQQVARTILY
jgi:hypothetical protein